MEKLELKAESRDLKTKPNNVRKAGKIPAVLYGHKVANTPLAITASEFEKVFKKAGENTLVELSLSEGKSHHVLIHDVQYHNLTGKTSHVDFLEVSMTEKLKANVPLEFVGEADAVKLHGGVLVKILDEVEVESLPSDLPHSIEVDIAVLKTFDDGIQVKDLKVPAKVTITTDGEELIAKVQPPRDVEAELAEAPVEDVTKVEGAAEDKPATEETKEETKE